MCLKEDELISQGQNRCARKEEHLSEGQGIKSTKILRTHSKSTGNLLFGQDVDRTQVKDGDRQLYSVRDRNETSS